MKKLFSRSVVAILIFGLLSGMAGALAAGAPSFRGHWAQKTLDKALSDGLITAGENGIDPDGAVTGAQLATILCRVLSPEQAADLSGVTDIKKSDWYYTAAAQAVALGIVTPARGRLNLSAPVTRGQALAALGNAFQLVAAQPDIGVLAQFSDSALLSGKYRMAAAALTSAGFVKGDGSALHIGSNISLAEFLTVLYRIVPNDRQAGQSTTGGGLVLSDNGAAVIGEKFDGNLYFDGTTSYITLQGVEAPCAVVRSGVLGGLSVYSSRIGRLVIAAGSGDVTVNPDIFSSVGTVAVGDGGGTVTIGKVPNVEVTGDGRNVILTGDVQNLTVSGSGCTVTVAPGTAVDNVKILGAAVGNTLTVNGSCGTCAVYGADTAVGGDGYVESVLDNTGGSRITVEAGDVTADESYGLAGAGLSLIAPEDLPSYLTLKASAAISSPGGAGTCTGLWYIDNAVKSASDVKLGASASSAFSYAAKNTGAVPVTVTLSFVLYYDDPVGGYQELRADKDIVLESADKFDAKDVLALVETGYKGDYTLKWAQAHDYDAALKTAWVNVKGYTSKTKYLVWVSLAYQRVNIFTGSGGAWELEKTFMAGTGAPGNDTPVGVFKIIGRSTTGWNAKEYTVKPVVNFYTWAYGFHSRLYYPGTTKILDARIGFPISHGCIRMYDEDIAWFYKNIPTNTTVVVY
ncbi:Lipoprotein-anchoring transpeptidase ErfK/SrfK [Sporobacter termitidis DSM 10068]|uniref:Lipoprotein-anchoring transpeptidase ErfK/SrfK n=1 Tax=Sporobacter termitidis DSM 10068 TaxID=1123282 RepID=A0A1M5YLD1_9FIRM|nr:L,D-transpeptidase family protein [Sporobacter termitidis]SHI12865.1 Lipoprotein-anchoring transpeptidase ErfK/SrfK [Sporobacter termitidis DSM 10068]